MPEPVKRVGTHHLVISSDDPARRRTWPDPESIEDLVSRAANYPDSLSVEDIRTLASVARAYRFIFSVSQREFLPTHAAIRAFSGRVGVSSS